MIKVKTDNTNSGVMVALYFCSGANGGGIVASWWRHGGVMVALVYALKPFFHKDVKMLSKFLF